MCTTDNVFCKTRNLIYLVACCKCKLQYVGETGRTLQERMNGHRAAMKGAKSNFLAEHFRTKDHSLKEFSIQIIEHFQYIGKKTDKERRLTKELLWEMKLCTVLPYGLDDKVRGVGAVSQSHNKIHPGILFLKHKRKRCSYGHRKNQKVSHHFNIYECDGLVNSDVNCLHEIKCSLFSLLLSELRIRSIDEEIRQLY